MRLRGWISVFAMLGVLLHAGALVRHHGVMLGAVLQYHALVSDLAEFCHGADNASRSPADLPSIPKPSDAKNGCPICSGQSPAFAVIAPAPLDVPAPTTAADILAFPRLLFCDAPPPGVSPSPRPPGPRLIVSKSSGAPRAPSAFDTLGEFHAFCPAVAGATAYKRSSLADYCCCHPVHARRCCHLPNRASSVASPTLAASHC